LDEGGEPLTHYWDFDQSGDPVLRPNAALPPDVLHRVTAGSMGKWLQANSDAISKTQSPAAVMRLQSIAGALQNARPGELADALKAELLPAAIGMATGGTEGGVFGVLLHKTGKTVFGSLDQKRQAAFSAAMEQAVLDPTYASRLAQAAAKAGSGVRPVRALARAVAATPLALNAAGAR